MKNLTIYKESVVAPIAEKILSGCAEVNQLARKETVELIFWKGEKVTIRAKRSCTKKVPAKALKSGEALISWMKEVINKAWS